MIYIIETYNILHKYYGQLLYNLRRRTEKKNEK